MSAIKGYVVRGIDRATGEACHHAPPLADRVGADGTLGYAPDQLDAAAWGAACLRRDSDDVRILAVDETGKETLRPSYEEAMAEIETLRGQRDAFRDHLDLAYRNAYTERKAWARLVEAEQVHHAQTVLLGERDDDAKGAFAEVVAARQALRDLGVDVGSWLGEGPAS